MTSRAVCRQARLTSLDSVSEMKSWSFTFELSVTYCLVWILKWLIIYFQDCTIGGKTKVRIQLSQKTRATVMKKHMGHWISNWPLKIHIYSIEMKGASWKEHIMAPESTSAKSMWPTEFQKKKWTALDRDTPNLFQSRHSLLQTKPEHEYSWYQLQDQTWKCSFIFRWRAYRGQL